jgi:hypothetical protein
LVPSSNREFLDVGPSVVCLTGQKDEANA